jgi:hypothetical protein
VSKHYNLLKKVESVTEMVNRYQKMSASEKIEIMDEINSSVNDRENK